LTQFDQGRFVEEPSNHHALWRSAASVKAIVTAEGKQQISDSSTDRFLLKTVFSKKIH